MGSANDLMVSTGMRNCHDTPLHTDFAVCIANPAYPAALELNKIYRVVRVANAEAEGDLRVIDESGEDYLYPATWFVPIEPPPNLQRSD